MSDKKPHDGTTPHTPPAPPEMPMAETPFPTSGYQGPVMAEFEKERTAAIEKFNTRVLSNNNV